MAEDEGFPESAWETMEDDPEAFFKRSSGFLEQKEKEKPNDYHVWCRYPSLALSLFFLLRHEGNPTEFIQKDRLETCNKCVQTYTVYRDTFSNPAASLAQLKNATGLRVFRSLLGASTEVYRSNVIQDSIRIRKAFKESPQRQALAVLEAAQSIENLLCRNNAVLMELEGPECTNLLTESTSALFNQAPLPVGLIVLVLSCKKEISKWARGIIDTACEIDPGALCALVEEFCSLWNRDGIVPDVRRYFRKPQTYQDFGNFLMDSPEDVRRIALSKLTWLQPLLRFIPKVSKDTVVSSLTFISTLFDLAVSLPASANEDFLKGFTDNLPDSKLLFSTPGEQFVRFTLESFTRLQEESVFEPVAALNARAVELLPSQSSSRNNAILVCVQEYHETTSVTRSKSSDLRSYTTTGNVLTSSKLHTAVRRRLLQLVESEFNLSGQGIAEPGASVWPKHLFLMASEHEYRREVTSLMVSAVLADCRDLFNNFYLLAEEISSSDPNLKLKKSNRPFWSAFGMFIHQNKYISKILDQETLERLIHAFSQVLLLEKIPPTAAQETSMLAASLRIVHEAILAFLKRELSILAKASHNLKPVWCAVLPPYFGPLLCSSHKEIRAASLRICKAIYEGGSASASVLDTLCGREDALDQVLASISQCCMQLMHTGIQNSPESNIALLFWIKRVFDLVRNRKESLGAARTNSKILRPILDFLLEVIQILLQNHDSRRGEMLIRCQDVIYSAIIVGKEADDAKESLYLISYSAVSLVFDDKQCTHKHRQSLVKILSDLSFFEKDELAHFLFQKATASQSGVDKDTISNLQKVAKKKLGLKLSTSDSPGESEAVDEKMTKVEKARKEYLQKRGEEKKDREQNLVSIRKSNQAITMLPKCAVEDPETAADKIFRRRDAVKEMYDYILQIPPAKVGEAGGKIPGVKSRQDQFDNVRQYAEFFTPFVWREVLAQIEKALLDCPQPLEGTIHCPAEKQNSFIHRVSLLVDRDSGKSSEISENSLLLIKKVSGEKLEFEVLAKVVGISNRRGDLLVHVLFSSKIMVRLPGPGTSLLIVPLNSLVTAHRQLQALFDLDKCHSTIKGMILNPDYKITTIGGTTASLAAGLTNSLNQSQRETVIRTVESPAPFSMVQGPPGTGKTTTIIALIAAILGGRPGRGRRVLVCAPSNAAVDEIQLRLMTRGILAAGANGPCCPISVRVGTASNNAQLEAISAFSVQEDCPETRECKARRGLIDKEQESLTKEVLNLERIIASDSGMAEVQGSKMSHIEERKNLRTAQKRKIELGKMRDDETKILKALGGQKERMKKARELIDRSSVVFATLSSCGLECLRSAKKPFSHVVVDESGQSIEPEVLIPLTALAHKPRHCLLVGDTKQLSATVLSKHASSSEVLGRSLMERMESRASKDIFFMLCRQYRMHPSLSAFPNFAFYNGNLRDSETVTGKEYHKLYHRDMRGRFGPITFYDTSGSRQGEERTRDMSYKSNHEATIVVRVLTALFGRFNVDDPIKNVAIICPYRGQVNEVRRQIRSDYTLRSRDNIEVTTVDGVQGREVDIVILTTVRGHGKGGKGIGFVAEPRRLNVAITRPKYSLILIGNGRALSSSGVWQKYLDHINSKGVILRASNEQDFGILFSQNHEKLRGPITISSDNVETGHSVTGTRMAVDNAPTRSNSKSEVGSDPVNMPVPYKAGIPQSRRHAEGHPVVVSNGGSSEVQKIGQGPNGRSRTTVNTTSTVTPLVAVTPKTAVTIRTGNPPEVTGLSQGFEKTGKSPGLSQGFEKTGKSPALEAQPGAGAGNHKSRTTESQAPEAKRRRTVPDVPPGLPAGQREKLPLMIAPPCPTFRPPKRGSIQKNFDKKPIGKHWGP